MARVRIPSMPQAVAMPVSIALGLGIGLGIGMPAGVALERHARAGAVAVGPDRLHGHVRHASLPRTRAVAAATASARATATPVDRIDRRDIDDAANHAGAGFSASDAAIDGGGVSPRLLAALRHAVARADADGVDIDLRIVDPSSCGPTVAAGSDCRVGQRPQATGVRH